MSATWDGKRRMVPNVLSHFHTKKRMVPDEWPESCIGSVLHDNVQKLSQYRPTSKVTIVRKTCFYEVVCSWGLTVISRYPYTCITKAA